MCHKSGDLGISMVPGDNTVVLVVSSRGAKVWVGDGVNKTLTLSVQSVRRNIEPFIQKR